MYVLICSDRIFDSPPFMYNKTFLINSIENCRPHLYVSFGTFCVQIGHLFRRWESLIIHKNWKSSAFSFENVDLSMFEHSSKAHVP